jgi:hypothetical protein
MLGILFYSRGLQTRVAENGLYSCVRRGITWSLPLCCVIAHALYSHSTCAETKESLSVLLTSYLLGYRATATQAVHGPAGRCPTMPLANPSQYPSKYFHLHSRACSCLMQRCLMSVTKHRCLISWPLIITSRIMLVFILVNVHEVRSRH